MSAGSPAIVPTVPTGEALFDLSRGRQALLSIAQPGLAAVLAAGGLPGWRTTSIGLVAAAAGFLAVFSLNDVLDRHADAAALRAGKAMSAAYDLDAAFVRHPLAAGQVSLRVALLWVGGLSLVAALGAAWLDPLCLVFFLAAAVLEGVYCALRAVTWTKTIVSGAMVGVGGLAGWVAVAPLDVRAAGVFAFLALWEIGGRNLANDLADLAPDSAVGLRTVATTFGPPTAARANLAVALAALTAVLVLGLGPVALVGSLVAGTALVAYPAVRLWREPTSARAGWYFNRASLYPPAVLLCALLGLLFTGSP
jgi:4-hydroxybenzoate polyprenyltransferase